MVCMARPLDVYVAFPLNCRNSMLACGMLHHVVCCWSGDLIVAYQCHNGWHKVHNGVRDVMTVTTMVSPALPLIGHCLLSWPSDWLMMVTTAMSHMSHEAHVSQSAPLHRFLTAEYQWSHTFPCHQEPDWPTPPHWSVTLLPGLWLAADDDN